MKFEHLKSELYTSNKFEGIREFYIIEDKADLKELIKAFPQLKKSWEVIRHRIKDIIFEGYVAIVTDINPKSNCIEVYYENVIPNVYTYDNAFHRATLEDVLKQIN